MQPRRDVMVIHSDKGKGKHVNSFVFTPYRMNVGSAFFCNCGPLFLGATLET
jgi:hypothetical protein